MQARIIRRTVRAPEDGSTHWSCRKMAAALGASNSTVQRIWAEARLKPHRLERYMASNDPEFEPRRQTSSGRSRRSTRPCSAWTRRRPFRRWIGSTPSCLCHQAEPNATASSTIATGRFRLRGVRYQNRQSGRQDRATPHKRRVHSFFSELVEKANWARENHIVLDKLSAHKTKAVEEFLRNHPTVRFHFTPTYSSFRRG